MVKLNIYFKNFDAGMNLNICIILVGLFIIISMMIKLNIYLKDFDFWVNLNNCIILVIRPNNAII